MVLLRWCKVESFVFLIRSFANTRLVICKRRKNMVLKQLSENKDLKKALKIIWLLSGFISIVILFTVLFVHPNFVFQNISTCEYKLLNKECFLCGTTRAFYKIKEFNIRKAYELNKFSPVLFSMMIKNILIITINYKNNFKNL